VSRSAAQYVTRLPPKITPRAVFLSVGKLVSPLLNNRSNDVCQAFSATPFAAFFSTPTRTLSGVIVLSSRERGCAPNAVETARIFWSTHSVVNTPRPLRFRFLEVNPARIAHGLRVVIKTARRSNLTEGVCQLEYPSLACFS